jgi:hypothetical protein
MIIELDINWTFTTPLPVTPYPIDIYYRLVGETVYTVTSISNGESESATITVLSDTSNTISNRDISCILDYEGYVVPVCANNAVGERVPFSTVEEDLTDLMQCRQIRGTCDAGGVFSIIPDPNPLLIFSTDGSVEPELNYISGSGNATSIPAIDIIWTTPAASSSTIQEIIVYPSGWPTVPSSPYYDNTTVFSITGVAGDKITPVTMTPTVGIGCWGEYNSCYTNDSVDSGVTRIDEGIVLCVDNQTILDYETLLTFGDVAVNSEYFCCQNSECRTYQLIWVGSDNYPSITSIQMQYISGTTGEIAFQFITSSSGSVNINAIPGTITTTLNSGFIGAFADGAVTVLEIGVCS